MKKLMIGIMVVSAALMVGAKTIDEMVVQKDYAGIVKHCKDNNIELVKFINSTNAEEWVEYGFANSTFSVINSARVAMKSGSKYNKDFDTMIATKNYTKYPNVYYGNVKMPVEIAVDAFGAYYAVTNRTGMFKATLGDTTSVQTDENIIKYYAVDPNPELVWFLCKYNKNALAEQLYTWESIDKDKLVGYISSINRHYKHIFVQSATDPKCTAMKKMLLDYVSLGENKYYSFVVAKQFDSILKNKHYYVQNNFAKFKKTTRTYVLASLELNDVDSLITALKGANNSLKSTDLNASIVKLNSLDINYKKADVLAALTHINSIYTINVYDNRDEWEPIISKIRAMIDLRK